MFFNVMTRHKACYAVYGSAVFEKNKFRCSGDLVLRRNNPVYCHVQPCEFHPPHISSGQFLQNRRQFPAVSSGRGEEFHHYRTGKIEDLAREVMVVYCENMVREPPFYADILLTSPAFCRRTPLLPQNFVLSPAVLTPYDKIIHFQTLISLHYNHYYTVF